MDFNDTTTIPPLNKGFFLSEKIVPWKFPSSFSLFMYVRRPESMFNLCIAFVFASFMCDALHVFQKLIVTF